MSSGAKSHQQTSLQVTNGCIQDKPKQPSPKIDLGTSSGSTEVSPPLEESKYNSHSIAPTSSMCISRLLTPNVQSEHFLDDRSDLFSSTSSTSAVNTVLTKEERQHRSKLKRKGQMAAAALRHRLRLRNETIYLTHRITHLEAYLQEQLQKQKQAYPLRSYWEAEAKTQQHQRKQRELIQQDLSQQINEQLNQQHKLKTSVAYVYSDRRMELYPSWSSPSMSRFKNDGYFHLPASPLRFEKMHQVIQFNYDHVTQTLLSTGYYEGDLHVHPTSLFIPAQGQMEDRVASIVSQKMQTHVHFRTVSDLAMETICGRTWRSSVDSSVEVLERLDSETFYIRVTQKSGHVFGKSPLTVKKIVSRIQEPHQDVIVWQSIDQDDAYADNGGFLIGRESGFLVCACGSIQSHESVAAHTRLYIQAWPPFPLPTTWSQPTHGALTDTLFDYVTRQVNIMEAGFTG